MHNILLLTFSCCVYAIFATNSTFQDDRRNLFLDVGHNLHLDIHKTRHNKLSQLRDDNEIQIPNYISAYEEFQEGVNKIQIAIEKYHDDSYNISALIYARLGVVWPENSAKIVSCYMKLAIDKMKPMSSLIENNAVKPLCSKPKNNITSEIPNCCNHVLQAIIQMSNLGPDADYLVFFTRIPRSYIKQLKELITVIQSEKDPAYFFKTRKELIRPYLEMNLKFQETYFPGEDNCLPKKVVNG